MRRALRSALGVLTLAACGLGVWYLFEVLDPASTRHGELLLQVRFSEAGNLVEGSPVRHRGVRVGEVRSIRLSPDGTGVLVEMAVDGQHQGLVRSGSRFWIVRPRFEGITRGVEGLDTLLRNPYVVFDTPEDGELATVQSGSLLLGLASPPADTGLPPLQGGDLVFAIHFARSFGLEAGAPVLLRDIRVGEVRAVELEESGQWSSVQVAIRQRYRSTVRANSVFWIQKPSVQSGWLASNIRATELGSLLTGPTLAFFTPEGAGDAVQPGAVLRGTVEPAEIPEGPTGPMVYVAPKNGAEAGRLAEAAQKLAPALAGISYSFEEQGMVTSERHVREGTAVLLRGADGRTLALTSRSLADGRMTVSDTFSEADLAFEQWKVRGRGGWAADATPVWTAPGGVDLAILELKRTGGSEGLEPGALGSTLNPEGRLQMVAFRGDGEPEFVVLPRQVLEAASRPGVHPIAADHARSLQNWEGAAVLDEAGRLVGVLGRRKPLSAQLALVSVELLASWQAAGK